MDQKKRSGWNGMSPRQKTSFLRTWSASKLKTFHTCAFQFYFTYIGPEDVPENIQNIFGSAIHRMLKRFFVVRFQSKKTYLRSWYYFWKVYTPKRYGEEGIRWGSVNHADEWQRYFLSGMTILSRFWDENEHLRGTERAPEVEQYFRVQFGAFTLRGYIDRRETLPGGGIAITDYKTGYRRYLEPEMLRDVQFTFYQYAEEVLHGRPPEALLVHRVSTGEKIPVCVRTKDDFRLLYGYLEGAYAFLARLLTETPRPADQELYERASRHVEPGVFMPRPGPHCNTCSFERECFARQYDSADEFSQRLLGQELAGYTVPDVSVQPPLKLSYQFKKSRKGVHRKDTKLEKHKRKFLRGKVQLSWLLP